MTITNGDGTPMSPRTNLDGSTKTLKRDGRGFAGMDPARQREIASQGGRAAHASGNAHQFTTEEARAAGSKRHAMKRDDVAEANAQLDAMARKGA